MKRLNKSLRLNFCTFPVVDSGVCRQRFPCLSTCLNTEAPLLTRVPLKNRRFFSSTRGAPGKNNNSNNFTRGDSKLIINYSYNNIVFINGLSILFLPSISLVNDNIKRYDIDSN